MNHRQLLLIKIFALFLLLNCGGSTSKIVSEETVSTFKISMPVKEDQVGGQVYRIWPFGVHGSVHAEDGHPGWDLEVVPGAIIYAAADGTVQSIFNEVVSGTYTIQIVHQDSAFRTIYTNIGVVDETIFEGAVVNAKQAIGVAATVDLVIGTKPVSFAMIHFQLDDFSQSNGISNTAAINPKDYLDEEGLAILDRVWSKAAYNQEICEPFLVNDRNASIPLTRSWVLKSGSHASRITFTMLDATANSYEYRFYDANDELSESGSIHIAASYPFGAIDFIPHDQTASHLGVLQILDSEMSLSYGITRPNDLLEASVYTTSN